MTTHQSRCEELATELERLNARANPGDGTDWLSACEDLGEFYAANTREIIALLRSLASQPAGVTNHQTAESAVIAWNTRAPNRDQIRFTLVQSGYGQPAGQTMAFDIDAAVEVIAAGWEQGGGKL